jgi:hypothetical protein
MKHEVKAQALQGTLNESRISYRGQICPDTFPWTIREGFRKREKMMMHECDPKASSFRLCDGNEVSNAL